MRLIISDTQPIDDDWTYVQDISLLDIFVENCEAKEIVVDFFLGNFWFHQLEEVIDVICRKLRLGGTITINDMDFDFLVNKMESEPIQNINNIVFAERAIKSFYTVEYITSLLEKHVKIIKAFFDDNNNFVLVGEKC